MTLGFDALMVILVLTSLMLLGSSRLGECIRMVAIQGAVLGLAGLLLHGHEINGHLLLLGTGSIFLKAVLFPWMLFRAMREAHVRREVDPFIGYGTSLLIGGLSLLVAFWVGARLPLAAEGGTTLVVPMSIFLILTGLFIIISRKIALMQVLGYLVLENGIFLFGVSLVPEQPVVVELGVLLDVFVGVFIMGIMIFHINREFDHIDVGRLASLKDYEP
jgi:hydrogenase-4 component E